MCKCASGVFTMGHKYHWSKTSDSHNGIIIEHGLCADGVQGPNVVPFEIYPTNGDLSLPLEQWVYRLDDTIKQGMYPEWYDAEIAEREARRMLVEWSACKLTGWRVHEAFHPVHPFKIPTAKMSREEVVKLLSVYASVSVSVSASVHDSVSASVSASIRDSALASVHDSIRDSALASVHDSALASVHDSVRYSIRYSIYAYIGSLFPNITTWEYLPNNPTPWNSLRELWLSGRVPSFDGKVWRIHAGPKAEVEYTFTAEEVTEAGNAGTR